MTQTTHLVGTWLLFAAWQSTLVLGLSQLLGRCFRKTPWQSHDLHLFGIAAAVLAPTFSTVIASQNIGWLSAGRFAETLAPLWDVSGMLGVMFLIGMALFLTLLGWGIVASRKLMFRAKPFPDRESQEALLRSSETLQNVSLPILFTSPSVKSPTVWCWGLHPAVVLPEELADNMAAQERDAIFLHELAHITRRDHLTALLTRICGLFLFWNPLYWLALKQADLLADEACDLLVLSRGNVSPETYTETLLRLAAGQRAKPAFQFLSRKEKIMKRINTILDFGELPDKPPVKPSRLWQGSALVVALLLSVTLAFCQEKKEVVTDAEGKFTLDATHPHDNTPVEGTVTMNGEPLAGATVTFAPRSDVTNTTVGGIVTLDGEPLEDATLTFFPQNQAKEQICAAITDRVGKYTLRAQHPVGAMYEIFPGQYRVAITKTELVNGRTTSLVPPEYTHEMTTPFVVTVEKGKNTFDFDLVSGEDRRAEKPAPKITKMEPANGAEDVDAAAVTELRVTFDRDMNTDGYSWCGGGGDSYPLTTGEPKWINKRTCVLPVKLQPGKKYMLSINARDFRNFKSAEGVSVVPVVYAFRTQRQVRSADDPQATIFEKLPQFPDMEADAKPMPDELVRMIAKIRKSVQSAEYTVTCHFETDAIHAYPILFRFQGDKQWYADISGSTSIGGSFGGMFPEITMMTGCDGEKEWSYHKMVYDDEKMKAHDLESWTERALESIDEINTSFLDPFDCLDVAPEELGELLADRGIVYLGETSFNDKPLQLFGTTFESMSGDEAMKNEIVFAFDAETFLPYYTLHCGETKTFGQSDQLYVYNITAIGREFSAEDFRPRLPESVTPEFKAEPEEGYDRFFVRVRDGADGRVSVRVGGQKGEKGTMSGGLN